MIKILLTSDLHIGSLSESIPVSTADRMLTLKKIISLAKDHDILLSAGDLFNVENLTESEKRDIIKVFSYLKSQGTKFILIPGENEYSNSEISPFMYQLNAEKVFGKSDDGPYETQKDGASLFIYGVPAKTEVNLPGIMKKSQEGFHIGLFHANLDDRCTADSGGEINTLQLKNLKNQNLDFYAVGHSHNFKLFKYQNEIIGACAGSPEAVNPDECGDRFVLSFTVENNQITQIKRLTINTCNVIRNEIDCSVKTADDIIHHINENKSPNTIMSLTLTGSRNYRFPWKTAAELSEGYLNFILHDKTSPSLDILIRDYGRDNSLRGDYFNLLKNEIENGALILNEAQLSKLFSIIASCDSSLPEDWLCALIHA